MLGMIWGCAKEDNIALPNTPPETFIAVADSVRNPTTYIQDVHWWGDDIDGEVIGYEYRWFQDPAEPGCPMDTGWVFTVESSREFHIPVTQGVIRTHRVEVRAMDDDEAVDPTPSVLRVPVTNTPPTVTLRDRYDLPDTTYPAITVRWDAQDADGRETISSFRVWLDGNEENAKHIDGEDSTASFGFDDFQGRYGERTLYLFAVDTGCDSSNLITHSWNVRGPVGNALVVDDLWSTSGAVNRPTDSTYAALMDSCVVNYSWLSLENFGGVTYAHNYAGLFDMFDLVVWYNDPVRSLSATLPYARDAVRDYAEGGGSFMLVSLAALGPLGAFSDETMFEVFGVDSLYWRLNPVDGSMNYNFDCKKSWDITGNHDVGLDSLKVTGTVTGTKCMAKNESSVSLYHIPPGTVDSIQKEDYYLAVMNDWGLGRVAVFTMGLSKCDGYGNLKSEFCKAVQVLLY